MSESQARRSDKTDTYDFGPVIPRVLGRAEDDRGRNAAADLDDLPRTHFQDEGIKEVRVDTGLTNPGSPFVAAASRESRSYPVRT